MIELLPNSAFPRRRWHWIVVALVAELLWFCFLYPLVPRTVPAVAFEALLPLLLLGYIYLAVRCLLWIAGRRWSRWTRQLLGGAIGLGAVATGIWLVTWAVIYLPVAFGYQLIREL
ncbi:MAG TPA: hypothetical protein VGV09_07400 [Steroidobacteraceae bacterium]|nr:hypothetical protein [Steroidobacteraceae bacterium]